MKKIVFYLILLLITGSLLSANLEYQAEIAYPQITDNGKYVQLDYDDGLLMGEEGNPLMPWLGINLLLPAGEELTGVNILDIEYYEADATGTIEPAGRLFPISQPAPAGYMAEPNPAIYGQKTAFPPAKIIGEGTGYLCGHGISYFSFCPVEYNPATSKMRFVSSVTFGLETGISNRANAAAANLKSSQKITRRLERIVENPEALSQYSYNSAMRIDDYDLLLITSAVLADDFQEYVDYKNSTGYSVAVETTLNIYSQYAGQDDAEKVRNCIIDYYQTYGIEYVILGGDAGNPNETAIVPHRGFAVDDDPSLPSDMYFSNLDGNWNNDGDNNWGEQNEIDPYSELSIGRMTVDSAAEVAHMINKHILYQNDPVVEDIEKAVMVGEELNNSPWTYGGNYKDQIVSGGYFDGYSTSGIANNINVNYFYDRDGGWNKYNLMDEFCDEGINLLNHLGHSSPTYNMKMENSDLTEANFTNNGITRGFAIGYSQGCYNGSFDNYHYNGYYTEDCFAEKISGGISGGYVACIANSRYGWYMPGGTNSSSQYYDRMFFDGIFGAEIFTIGDVNSYSHEDNVSYMQTNSNMRWVCYQTNLFGDPSLDIWTEEPADMSVTVPASVSIGVSQISIQTNVFGARVAVCQNGELLGRGITGFNGLLTLELEAAISDPTPLDLSITAHNYNRYEGVIVVVSDQPYVIYQGHTLDDSAGNGNGEADYAETISIDLELYNVGNQNANNTALEVTTEDEYITMLDGTETIGLINAESIIELMDAISFEIGDDIPDQHLVSFTVTVTGDDREEWVSYFSMTVNAPDLLFGGIIIDDSIVGDNDGILDPGETAEVTLEILNIGQSDSPFASLELSSGNPELSIEELSVSLGVISANGSAAGVFTVNVGTDIEIGTPVALTLVCLAGNYTFLEEFTESVGLIIEDFESGDFSAYNWEFGGNANWMINSSMTYEGSYSAQSGSIGNNADSELSLAINVLFNGEISFMYRLSSEAGYDFLRFYIDGVEQGAWSGEIPWAEASFNISQGEHTLLWQYSKDVYVSSGSDCAWLDYIIFPAIGIPDPAVMVLDTVELNFILEEGETGFGTLNISNEGEENLIWNLSKNYLDSPRLRDSGGPDGYGYMWMDSNDGGDVEFDWIDISVSGTQVNFPHNDEGTDLLPIGFTYNFYGVDYNEFLINANGWIGFGDDNTEWSNSSLPDSDAPHPAIMPLWDDLYPAIGGNGGGEVYYQTIDDYLVVMFDDVIHYPGEYNGTYDFELIIRENGEMKFQYNDLSGDLDTCTIGIQDASADNALQILHNADYLEEGLAIEIRRVIDWLDISASSGEIMMNNEQDLQITVNTDELEAGEYTCELIFHSNDPLMETFVLPVYLTIGAGIIYGDVDASLVVEAYDASCVLQYIVGLDPLPELDPIPWETERLEAADVDNNNIVEAYDGSLILQYVVGLINEFPAQNGEPVNAPETGIRMECVFEENTHWLLLISEGNLYSLSMEIIPQNIELGEPVLNENTNALLAYNEAESYRLAVCNATPFAADQEILRLPVVIGENAEAEIFAIQINTADWEEQEFDFAAVEGEIDEIVFANQLLGNYPNPFNPQTSVLFSVKENNTPVKINIYNIKGQQVAKLTDTEFDSGRHQVLWNAARQASGVYFYRIQIAEYEAINKMILIK